MWTHKVIKLISLIFLLLLFCCTSEGTIHINGDGSYVGSKVYIDNVYKGKLLRLKKGALLSIKVENGVREIIIIKSDSIVYEKKINLKNETYIGI